VPCEIRDFPAMRSHEFEPSSKRNILTLYKNNLARKSVPPEEIEAHGQPRPAYTGVKWDRISWGAAVFSSASNVPASPPVTTRRLGGNSWLPINLPQTELPAEAWRDLSQSFGSISRSFFKRRVQIATLKLTYKPLPARNGALTQKRDRNAFRS